MRAPPTLRRRLCSPVGIAAKKRTPQSEPAHPDNRTDNSRTHSWRSRPTAEQERNIPQAVLFGTQAANSRRDRTQDISTGTHDRRRTNARHLDRAARKTFREERMAGMRQTKNIPIEPHNRRDSSAEPHRGNHIADTNGRAIRSIACARFKRNPTARRAGHPHPSAEDTFPCGKPRFPPPSEKRIQTNIP